MVGQTKTYYTKTMKLKWYVSISDTNKGRMKKNHLMAEFGLVLLM